nr:MAG TPA: hypothetical protein [Bacteriophage sp.]
MDNLKIQIQAECAFDSFCTFKNKLSCILVGVWCKSTPHQSPGSVPDRQALR